LPEEIAAVVQSSRYEYLSADIRDRDALTDVMRTFRPTVICHMASGLRDDSPDFLFRTNVEGTIKLLEAIDRSGSQPARVLLGSTGGVYGSSTRDHLPLDEEAPCNPVDLYSASKLAAEHVSAILARKFGIPVIWCRLFNLVGPGQEERHACGRFASWVAAMMRKQVPPTIEVGSLHSTRDFLDIRDTARALEMIMNAGEPGRAYNVGSGQETTIGLVLKTLLELAGLQDTVRIEQVVERSEDIPRHYADIRRIEQLGFKSEIALQQSLKDLLEYYDTMSVGKVALS
jgi:GDP-4-dehydro-6-deoxy-D-mannose reductase